jgi:hypothetical protein
VAAVLAIGTASAAGAAAPRLAPAASTARPAPNFTALPVRLGFGSGRRYGYGYGYRRRPPSILHRVVKTAIWLYVLHLFFSHGGLSILLWLLIIGLVFSLARRRRRYTYRAQSPWR